MIKDAGRELMKENVEESDLMGGWAGSFYFFLELCYLIGLRLDTGSKLVDMTQLSSYLYKKHRGGSIRVTILP